MDNMKNMKTKREYFAEIAALMTEAERPDLAEFCNKQIEQLGKRTKASGNLTSKQTENLELMDKIVAYMATVDSPVRIADIMANVPGIKSNQHANAILIAARRDGKVERIQSKDGTTFKLPDDANTAEEEG